MLKSGVKACSSEDLPIKILYRADDKKVRVATAFGYLHYFSITILFLLV